MSAAFNNPASQRERAEIVKNERKLRRGEREATTYHRLAGLADDLGGRFAAEAGQSKATDYPRQDSASPWSGGGADPGVEPPTGEAIDAMEPCGEQFEIEKSLETGAPETGAMTHPPRVLIKSSRRMLLRSLAHLPTWRRRTPS
jgi:hypothetical protein